MPYNKRYAAIRPGGVALCADTADVQTALAWARRYDVPFAARSGGHSYAGYCASRGLVISLAPMRSIRVDQRALTVTLGAGTRNRDLHAGLAGTGLAVPSGRCPTVGVSGLLLGGGFGFSSRHLGLTCDQLLETEVVTAAGGRCGSARWSSPTCSGPARAEAAATSASTPAGPCAPPRSAGSRSTNWRGPGGTRPPR